MAFKMKNPFKQMPAMPLGASLSLGLDQSYYPTKEERAANILADKEKAEKLALKKKNEKQITMNSNKVKKNNKTQVNTSDNNFA